MRDGCVSSQLNNNTSALLHKGKSPRVDVWVRLGLIASEFLAYPTYPIIQSRDLSSILDKALGPADFRVKMDYRKTILHYCNINDNLIEKKNDTIFKQIDAQFYVTQIPKRFLIPPDATSTSFFEQNIYENP